MSFRFSSRLAVAVLLAAAVETSICGQDWAQWRGPGRDGVVAGFQAPKSWPEQLKTRWTVKVGIGHSSPLVAGNRVYQHARQGDNEVVLALDLATGKVIWQDSYPAAYTVNPAAVYHAKGPKSTPIYANGKLYTLGITGILSCYDTVKGRLLWRKDFFERFRAKAPLFGTAMSPVIDSGMIIVHAGGNDQGGMVALDAATGAEKWAWTGDGPGYASPIVIDAGGKRQIVTQSQKYIVGISVSDGGLLWKIPFETEYVQNIVTPVVYKDLLIFSGINKGVFAVRLGYRDNRWVADQVWSNREVSMYMNSPVISGQMIFGLSHKNKGQFFCLDAATGKTLWTGDPRQGENAAMLLAGNVLLSLTNDAHLIVTDPASRGARVIRNYTVADSPTWAHPAISGKNIIIKDENSLRLLGLE